MLTIEGAIKLKLTITQLEVTLLMPTLSRVKPKLTFNKGIAGFFIFLHLGALLAFFPFAFSWSAVALMLFLHWLTASIGICFGYHRYLTHRGMDLPRVAGKYDCVLSDH